MPVGGAGRPTQLNGPLTGGGNVLGYAVGAFGTLPRRVVYLADQDVDETTEVFGVPLSGGTATQINGPLVAGGDVVNLTFTVSGVLVYLADQDVGRA